MRRWFVGWWPPLFGISLSTGATMAAVALGPRAAAAIGADIADAIDREAETKGRAG